MKKKLTWMGIMVLLATVCMAGCKTEAPEAANADLAAVTATAVVTAEPTQAPTPEPTAEPTPEPTAEPREFERGAWSDSVFENGYLNLCFEMPEGFIAASDEEMDAMMELSLDAVENENVNELQMKLASLKTVYAMMASNGSTGSNVVMMIENLAMTPGGTNFTEKDYLEILKNQLVETQVSGYSYTAQDSYETTFCGETYYVLPVTLGDGLMKQEYYLRRVDDRMLAICFSCAGGNEAELVTMKDAFTTMDA